MLTIKELKEIIKDLPDEMEVGTRGHFGEILDCYDCEVDNVFETISSDKKKRALMMLFCSPGQILPIHSVLMKVEN